MAVQSSVLSQHVLKDPSTSDKQSNNSTKKLMMLSQPTLIVEYVGMPHGNTIQLTVYAPAFVNDF